MGLRKRSPGWRFHTAPRYLQRSAAPQSHAEQDCETGRTSRASRAPCFSRAAPRIHHQLRPHFGINMSSTWRLMAVLAMLALMLIPGSAADDLKPTRRDGPVTRSDDHHPMALCSRHCLSPTCRYLRSRTEGPRAVFAGNSTFYLKDGTKVECVKWNHYWGPDS